MENWTRVNSRLECSTPRGIYRLEREVGSVRKGRCLHSYVLTGPGIELGPLSSANYERFATLAQAKARVRALVARGD